jgi:hypothetical protein
MSDPFAPYAAGISDPAAHAFLITPVDADLAHATRGICFATAGALRVTTVGGDDVTFPSGALAAGIVHAIRARRVWATNTTASGIVGVW